MARRDHRQFVIFTSKAKNFGQAGKVWILSADSVKDAGHDIAWQVLSSFTRTHTMDLLACGLNTSASAPSRRVEKSSTPTPSPTRITMPSFSRMLEKVLWVNDARIVDEHHTKLFTDEDERIELDVWKIKA